MKHNYTTQLDRVTEYIYSNLEEDLDIDVLASVACLSTYHWHRIYTAVKGETVMTTIRRLRMKLAADRLANTETPINKIAERAGYSSNQAFNRAFKESFGVPPAAYRRTGQHTAINAATSANDASAFKVNVVQGPEIRFACIDHVGSYMQIDQAMALLFSSLEEQSLISNDMTMCAMFFNDPDIIEENKLRSKACVAIPATARFAAPVTEYVLEAGPYAKLDYFGPYATMASAYRWMYGVWLPQSGYLPAEKPGFERYLNSPAEVAQNELHTEICIPLAGIEK